MGTSVGMRTNASSVRFVIALSAVSSVMRSMPPFLSLLPVVWKWSPQRFSTRVPVTGSYTQ